MLSSNLVIHDCLYLTGDAKYFIATKNTDKTAQSNVSTSSVRSDMAIDEKHREGRRREDKYPLEAVHAEEQSKGKKREGMRSIPLEQIRCDAKLAARLINDRIVRAHAT